MKNVKVLLSTFAIVMIAALFIGGCAVPSSDNDENDNGGGGTAPALGPAPVLLGSAGSFVILAETAITNTPVSVITGDIGISPASSTGITGMALVLDGSGMFATAPQVSGRIYAANYTVPTPSNLTAAITDMTSAYTDAAGRLLPDFTDIGTAGNIGGLTLVPGLYKWTTAVTIPTDIILDGGPNDTWIFQIAGTLNVTSAKTVILTGGAQAKNIFWQTTGAITLNTTAHIEGIVLSLTSITLNTGASVTGRLFAQTAVALNGNAVLRP